MPVAIILTFPCQDTELRFSGRWLRTKKSKTGSLVW